ncbi:WAS/WASL-interacting protein family member 1-like isoform X2 [Ischnura elegans]|uniref:WAS/WASL-interacting protein family member 1-like isoform X2 n=1 Tax=Ischnura elegans TaxID=197161 RepID=UPI001ED88AC9|nr:WAS/WASL-interacting protein family member 1-like isoform X2 [Ischnura elegans]
MPFLPPPPPPGPPPPPSFSLNSKEAPKPSGGGPDGRDLLLHSIRQGAKLKKTVTNDRSAPLVSGKSAAPTAAPSARSYANNGNNEVKSNGVPAGGLGGLFAGGMPKLKPTGRAIGGVSPATSSSSSSSCSSGSDHVSPTIPQSETGRRGFPADIKNRGPPPQPPPSSQKPNISSSASDSTLSNSSPMTATKKTGNPPLPSKPPVSSYGKPNVAPKPPGAPRPPPPSAKPSPPPKSPGNSHPPPSLPSRPPSVTRAQSMRAPRSPGPLPSPELGDFRGPRFQSQDALHHMSSAAPPPPPAPSFPPPPRTATLPSNLNGLQQANGGVLHAKGAAPPPPPSCPPAASLGHRTAPAPPQYARPSPLRAPLTRPPPPPRSVNPPLCPPPPPPTSAPPPPPHRTNPAPPPKQAKLPVNAPQAPSGAPPPPPVRNSSMRNGSQSAADFEARYAEYFHSVKDFPLPERYTNCVKVYQSKSGYNRRNTGRVPDMNAKQPAPQPPQLLHVQLSNKMWTNESSVC